jgi:hypothetical protein
MTEDGSSLGPVAEPSGEVANQDETDRRSGTSRPPTSARERAMGTWPEMHCLGGEDQFEAYAERFRVLYRSGPFCDILERRVIFPPESCRHVCFEPDYEDRGNKARVIWCQERAEHIAWIHLALTDPTEIRWNHQDPRNQAYLLGFPTNNPARPIKRYYVSVEPKGPKKVVFLTAFPIQQN